MYKRYIKNKGKLIRKHKWETFKYNCDSPNSHLGPVKGSGQRHSYDSPSSLSVQTPPLRQVTHSHRELYVGEMVLLIVAAVKKTL